MKDLDRVANPGKTGDPKIDRALQDLADTINTIRRFGVMGNEIKGLRPSTTPTTIKVNHGLGRRPRGWVVTRIQNGTPTTLHETASPNPEKELWLSFAGSIQAEIDVRVF